VVAIARVVHPYAMLAAHRNAMIHDDAVGAADADAMIHNDAVVAADSNAAFRPLFSRTVV
jgi:hypothetical protein